MARMEDELRRWIAADVHRDRLLTVKTETRRRVSPASFADRHDAEQFVQEQFKALASGPKGLLAAHQGLGVAYYTPRSAKPSSDSIEHDLATHYAVTIGAGENELRMRASNEDLKLIFPAGSPHQTLRFVLSRTPTRDGFRHVVYRVYPPRVSPAEARQRIKHYLSRLDHSARPLVGSGEYGYLVLVNTCEACRHFERALAPLREKVDVRIEFAPGTQGIATALAEVEP